jgi:hypothetical protein
MRFTQCRHCDGHGTVISDYDWSELPCLECGGAGLLPPSTLSDVMPTCEQSEGADQNAE